VSYIVGIDLGTTNCAVAYVDARTLKGGLPKIQNFDVPQLTRPGHVEARPLLPSFLYLAGEKELPKGSTALPWDMDNDVIIGELARELGAKVPGRLVASAKSWLCSPSVDRTASILPWGAPEGVKRTSPVEASALCLAHIRAAWDHVIAKGDKAKSLSNQEIVITVPASFDEAARELTVDAADLAGLPKITLLEEPQAAFYAWIAENFLDLDARLANVNRVLVCDVGGGTTDFSLIDVKRTGDEKHPVELTRSAVGDHLMLGGDNMDLAIARALEKKVTGHLDAHQFKALTAAARDGKEKLLSAKAPEKLSISVMGRGTSVIGGSVKMPLLREEVAQILIDGFFSVAKIGDEPVVGRSGIREWGLPYVHDPAVTRHMGQFLRRHAGSGSIPGVPRPDAVLFNGGAMKPAAFRQRVRKMLWDWFAVPGAQASADGVAELESPSLDLAVALGAAYYGCARKGSGLRIGGGMGRSYYIGIETETGKAAICIVPRGTLEGDQLELAQTFILRLASPVVFPLFSSSVRSTDKIGTIIEESSADLVPLPPLETVLHAGRRAVKKDVSVRLQSSLTEVGTLELALKSVSDERRWEVHLNIRARQAPTAEVGTPGTAEAAQTVGGTDPRKLEAALALIRRTYDPQSREPIPAEILTRQIESALQLSKEAWPAPLARRLADALLDQAVHRGRSAEHETRWLNLAGYLLRPGFGDLADPERMKRLYNATRTPLNFVSEPNCRIEWWVLWRRVSGGLKEDQERELYYRLQPFLFEERDVTKRGGWPRPSKGEVPEMWRAVASLELLDQKNKRQLGTRISDELTDEGPTTPLLWSLARIGAREPAYAAPHVVVPIDAAEAWLTALLAMDWAGNPTAIFAAVNLARKTGDRTRDISDALRTKVLARLKKEKAGEHDIAAVKTITELESADRKMIFGDALPSALQLKTEAEAPAEN
jgi:molecular chaperone DnaK (HSP70)